MVVDNLSAHKTDRVDPFLREHPRVKMHLTPTLGRITAIEMMSPEDLAVPTEVLNRAERVD
jgi:hypothetical protein